MSLKVTITDYGVGNLYSIRRSLEMCGAEVEVITDMLKLEDAECIVFPGVGAFNKSMERLLPYRDMIRERVSSGVPTLGICIGMQIMFEGSGIEVYDLGADVPPERFIEAAREHGCDIIACSSLLTTTMQEMRQIVELSEKAGIRDKVTVMVGGAPISQSFCAEIGADIYTPDAASAARAAVKILTK